MKKELEEKLFNDFPGLFKHRDDPMTSLMCFGCECADGWYNLIWNLCNDINTYYVEHGGVPEHFNVQQVKEKFGGLRFYITFAPQPIHDMIHEAENKSYYICEHCGKKNTYTGKGKYRSFYRDGLPWIQTLCDQCLRKHLQERGLPYDEYISEWQQEKGAPFIEYKDGEKHE